MTIEYYGKLSAVRAQFRRDKHAVLQFDKDGKLVKEWKNAHAIVLELGLHSIYSALRRDKCEVGGFIWRYKIDAE